MIGVLLMIKRFIKLYISDLGLQFTNRSLIIKFQTLYVDQRRQSMFDKLLQSTRVNDKCSTEFTYAGYIRFVLLTYFGWTSLEGYYKISMLARFICLLLTRYQLNKLVYLIIHRGTTPAWWFWFLLVNRQEIEIQYFKQRVFLNYYTSNLMLTWSYGLFGDEYNHYLIQPINNRRQPIWFYMRYRWEQQWLPFWLWFNDRLVYRRVIYYRVRDYLVLPTGSKRSHYGVAQMFFNNRYQTVTNYWMENQIRLAVNGWHKTLNKLLLVDQYYVRFSKTQQFFGKSLKHLKQRYRQTNKLTFFARVERRWWRDLIREANKFRFYAQQKAKKKLLPNQQRVKFKNHQRTSHLIKNYPWRQPLQLETSQHLIIYDPYQYDQTITDYTLFGDDYLIPFEDQQDDASPSGDEADHQNYDYGLKHGYETEIPYASRNRARIQYTSTHRRLTVEGLAMRLFRPYRRKFEVQPVEDDYSFVFNQLSSPLFDDQRLLSSGDGPSAVDHEYDDEEIEQQQTDLAYLHDWSLTQVLAPTLTETNYHDGTFGWFFNWSQFNHQRLNLMPVRHLLRTNKQFKNTWQINSRRHELRRFAGGRRLRRYRQRMTRYLRHCRPYQWLSYRRQLTYYPPRYPMAELFVPFKFRSTVNFKFFTYYHARYSPVNYAQKQARLKYLPARVYSRFKHRARSHRWSSRLERKLNFHRFQRQPTLYFYQILSRQANYRLYYNQRYLINRPQPRRLTPNQYYSGGFFPGSRLLHPEVSLPAVNAWWVLTGLLVADDWYDYTWDTDHQSRSWLDWPWANFFGWSTPTHEGYELLNQTTLLTKYDRLPPRVGYQRWHVPARATFDEEVENYYINQFRFLHLQAFTFNRENTPHWSYQRSTQVSARSLVEGVYFNNHYYEPQYFAPFYPQYEDDHMPLDNAWTTVDVDYFTSKPLLTYKTLLTTYRKVGNLYFHTLSEAYLEWLLTRYDQLTYYSPRHLSAPTSVGARAELFNQRLLRNQIETPQSTFRLLRVFHLGSDHLLEKPVSTRRYNCFEYLQVTSAWENHLNRLTVSEWRQQSQQFEINFRTSLESTHFLHTGHHYYTRVKAYLLENNWGLRFLAVVVGPYYFMWYYRARHLNTEYQRVLPQTSYLKVSHRLTSVEAQTSIASRSTAVDQQGYLMDNTFRRSKHLWSIYPPYDEVMENRWLPTDKQPPLVVGVPEHYKRVKSRYSVRRRVTINGVLHRQSVNRYTSVYTQKSHLLNARGYKKNQLLIKFTRFKPYSTFTVRQSSAVYQVSFGRRPSVNNGLTKLHRAGLLFRLATTSSYHRRQPLTTQLQLRSGANRYPRWVVRSLNVQPLPSAVDPELNTYELKRTKVNQRHTFLKQFQPFLADEHEIMGERNYFHHYDTEFRYRMVRRFKKKSVYGRDLTSNYIRPVQVPINRRPTKIDQFSAVQTQTVNLIVQQNLQHQITTNGYQQSLSGCELPLLPVKPGLYYNTIDQLRQVKFPATVTHHQTEPQSWLMVDSDCDYQDQQFYGDNGDEDQSGDFVLQHDSLFAEYQTVEYLLTECYRLVTVGGLQPVPSEQRVRQNLTSYRRHQSLPVEHYRLSVVNASARCNGQIATEFVYGAYSVDHPAYQQIMLGSYHLPVVYRRLSAGSRRQPELGYQQLNDYKYYFKFQKTTPQYLGDQTMVGGSRHKFKLTSVINQDYPVCNTQRTVEYYSLSEYPLLTYEYLNTLEVHTIDLSTDVTYLENDQTVSTFNELSLAYNFNTLCLSQIYLLSVWRPTETVNVYRPVLYPYGINPDREIISDLVNHTRHESLLLEQLLNTYHEGYDVINYYTELQNDWTYHNEYVDDPDHDEEEDLSELTRYDLPVGITRYSLVNSYSSSEEATHKRLANQQVSTTFDYLVHLNLQSKRHLLEMADVYQYYSRRRALPKYQRRHLRLRRLVSARLNPNTYIPVLNERSVTSVNHQQSLTVGDLNQQQLSDGLLMDNFFTFWSLTETYYNDTPNGYTTGY